MKSDAVARVWYETDISGAGHFTGNAASLRPAGKFGAPGGTRTPGRLLRRQLLYPTELQAPLLS
jgi:hypothetical protein